MKPVAKIVKSRWYLCASVGEPGHQTLEVQSELGSYPSYTAAHRVLCEDDPDAVNEPGTVLQRRKEKYKHLRYPIKGETLLRNYAGRWKLV
jgi:hypothetical protein